MTASILTKAEDFIWSNARLLERQRFAFHFFGGPKSAVLAALRAYQNPDGGFGNALEPDKRYPGSNAIDVMTAFYILDEIDALDDPMTVQSCDFLTRIITPEGGVPFAIPQMKAYPHAPWWATDNPNPPAEINPTGDLTGLLLKHGINHPWLDQAVPFCWQALDPSREGYHDIMPAVMFLAHAPDRKRADSLLDQIRETILSKKLVAYDRSSTGYQKFPLDWAPTPDHPLRSCFRDAEIEADLQALIETQNEDGGWEINWPPVSKAVELEWRGILTVNRLSTLHAYNIL